MATLDLPIINWASVPDTTGTCWVAKFDGFATNDVWQRLVIAFSDTAARHGFHGGFHVPQNYVGTPVAVIKWTSAIITGNVVWDFDYRAVGGNDAESLDQATVQQAVTVTDAAPTTTLNLLEATVALTGANFAANDEVEFDFFRDGANAADTMANTAVLFELIFRYSDT